MSGKGGAPRTPGWVDPWSDPEKVKALVSMWDEGTTAVEIGRRLGLTKGQILGKVNRLHLTHRHASPAGKPPPAQATVTGGPCVWPMGDPREKDFHFCGQRPVLPGKPYCETHCALAYSKDPVKPISGGYLNA